MKIKDRIKRWWLINIMGRCPKCLSKMELIGVETDFDFEHSSLFFPVYLQCKGCHSKFIPKI